MQANRGPACRFLVELSQWVGIEEVLYSVAIATCLRDGSDFALARRSGAALIGWSIFRGALYSLRDNLDQTQLISEPCFNRCRLLKAAAVQLRC